MAIEVAVATGLSRTTTGTTSYEVTGFGTPQAAIVIASAANSTNNPAAQADLSIGFTDGTNHQNVGIGDQDNVTTTDTRRMSGSVLCDVQDGDATQRIYGSFSAWATNGLTISWTQVDSVQLHITVILIKGCTNVKVGNSQLTTTGVNDITTVGFKPNLVFISSILNSTLGNADNNLFSFGAAHNNSSDVVSQGHISFASANGQSTAISDIEVRSNSVVGQHFNGIQQWYGAAESFDTSGFSIDTGTDSPGNDYIFWLALDTGDTDGVDISIVDSPTSTGTWNQEAPGFEPQFAMLVATPATAVHTLQEANPMGFAIGAFDGTDEACIGLSNDDAASTTDTQSNYADKAMQLYEYSGGSASIMHEATFTSFDSLGYNLSFPTHVDGTTRKWLSIAIEGATTGYTLTADAGSYSVTGAAASALYDRIVSAEAGSYSVAGQAASLLTSYRLVSDAGSYAITGTPADLLAGRVLTAEAGAYTWTGTAADLIYNTATNFTLTAEAGAYVVTGASVGLRYDRVLVAEGGAYTITGAFVTLLYSGASTTATVISGNQMLTTKQDTSLPLEVIVDQGGGVSGLTVIAKIRDPLNSSSYLDFNDMTFKTSGWTSQTTTLTDVGGGFYSTTLDVTAITNLPTGKSLSVEYTVSGSVNAVTQHQITFLDDYLTTGKFIGLS